MSSKNRPPQQRDDSAPAGVRRFSMADQLQFAELTGDRNPMHLDEVAARRTEAGAAVVHGVHVVLWALDVLAVKLGGLKSLSSLNVEFSAFAHLDREVALIVRRSVSAEAEVEAMIGEAVVAKIGLRFGTLEAESSEEMTNLPAFAFGSQPLCPSREEMAQFRGWLSSPVPETAFEAAFPHACGELGRQRVAALGLLSTAVGMIRPGSHSIFSGFSVRMTPPSSSRAGIGLRAKSFHPSFRILKADVAGPGISGEITAFERVPPVETSLTRIRQLIRHDEFSNRHALIVGGSRGLGAATAKMIAAGGGRVVATYVRGVNEAEELRTGLNAAFGNGACRIMQYGVCVGDEAKLSKVRGEITHLYYFATPHIFNRSVASFDPMLFQEFVRYYIQGFAETLDALLLSRAVAGLSAFYPSSVAVETRPKQMTEYAMAKAAGEILCRDLAQRLPGLSIVAPRLPRILTDQTASISRIKSVDAVDTLLPLLRVQMPLSAVS